MLIWKHSDKKSRHNDVIAQNNGNNGKMRTSAQPNKIYIIGKVLMRATRNVIFIEFEPLCQKLWEFM